MRAASRWRARRAAAVHQAGPTLRCAGHHTRTSRQAGYAPGDAGCTTKKRNAAENDTEIAGPARAGGAVIFTQICRAPGGASSARWAAHRGHGPAGGRHLHEHRHQGRRQGDDRAGRRRTGLEGGAAGRDVRRGRRAEQPDRPRPRDVLGRRRERAAEGHSARTVRGRQRARDAGAPARPGRPRSLPRWSSGSRPRSGASRPSRACWATGRFPESTPRRPPSTLRGRLCRRAERRVVQLAESGEEVGADLLAYLNRLSDLLWIFGRQIEAEAGVDAALRTGEAGGPKWSRAW